MFLNLLHGLVASTLLHATAIDSIDNTPSRTVDRYTIPAYCVAGIKAERSTANRLLETQVRRMLTYGASAAGDTGSASVPVTQLERSCVSRFTLANTPNWQWSDLLALAVQLRNDTLARSVARALLNLPGTEKDRTWARNVVYQTLLPDSEPPHYAIAESLIPDLKLASGAPDVAAQAMAWSGLQHAAEYWVDSSRARTYATRSAALQKGTAGDTQAAPQLGNMTGFNPGAHAIPLKADFWFPSAPTGHSTGDDPVVPGIAPGTVTLLVAGDAMVGYGTSTFNWRWEAETGVTTYVRDVIRRYQARGLTVTLVFATRGEYFDTPLTPRDEAVQIAHIVRDTLHLPVTVAVVTSIMRRPYSTVDGRRTPCTQWWGQAFGDSSVCPKPAPESFGSYADVQFAPLMLVDRHGNLLYRGTPSPTLDHILDKQFETSGATAPSASSATPTP